MSPNELNEAKPYKYGKILVFDLDDTIVVTPARIWVKDKLTGEDFSLTPEEFNTFQKKPSQILSFDEFQSLEIMKAGKLINYYFKILKEAYRLKIAVGIVTARDNHNMIYRWLRYHLKTRIDGDLIFAVNDNKHHNFKGDIAERKKQAFREIIEQGFNDLQFYDDDAENLRLVKSLEKEYPEVKISTIRARKSRG
tara:strand:- start:1742 stop:2326 length:585 start_codon:yes stop_codon:yes gene_type:complete